MRKTTLILWLFCILAASGLYLFLGTETSALLLAAAVLLPPAQFLLAVYGARGLKVEVVVPKALQKGKSTEGHVIIDNKGFIPIVFVRVEVEIDNMLTRERRLIECSTSVMPRSSKKLPLLLENRHCGKIVFTIDSVKTYDFWGVFSPRSHATIQAPFHRIIAPELFSASVYMRDSETEAFDETIQYLDRKGSDKTEVFQLRDYAEGDSMGQIRWKLAAKYGKLIVADPSEPLDHRLLIIWDGADIPEDASPDVPDALAEAFVTLCVGLSEGGTLFTLAWKGGKTGRTELKNITGLSDIYDIVPELLSPEKRGYTPFDIPGKWPRAAYFSGQTLPEAYKFAEKISGFICTKNAEECPDELGATIIFSPENYQNVLAEMIL